MQLESRSTRSPRSHILGKMAVSRFPLRLCVRTARLTTKPSHQQRALQILRFLCLLWVAGVSLPAEAQYDPPRQITASPGGVNLADGRFTYQATDLSIGPLKLERSYLGGQEVKGSNFFGYNWTHNYGIHVVEGEYARPDKTFVVLGRTSVHFMKSFVVNGLETYRSSNPDSLGSSLVLNGSAFVYTDRQGVVYTFNPSVNAFPPVSNINPPPRNQRVARIDYPDGHALTFTYGSNGKPTQIASNLGYSLVFQYGPNGYVSQACAFNRAVTFVGPNPSCSGAAKVVSYLYGSGTYPNVTSVIDTSGQTWGYGYLNLSNVSQLSCVRLVNSPSCGISNFYEGERSRWVTRQTMADGSVWNYGFYEDRSTADDPQLPGEAPLYSSGGYTDPTGVYVLAEYGGGLMTSLSQGGSVSTFAWNGIELASLQYSEGNKLTYGRDGRGNIVSETWTAKPGSGTAAVSRSFAFPDPELVDCTSVPRAICNQPSTTRDYNGYQTDFTYDPIHGGVLTETGPAVSGVRPQTRHEYAQRYAWILGSGGHVPAASPIWVRTATSFCRTSAATGNPAAPCAVAGDEVRTTYDYGPDSGPNNLSLRGQAVTATEGGVTTTLRTCFGYDGFGQRISETQPNANLANCP